VGVACGAHLQERQDVQAVPSQFSFHAMPGAACGWPAADTPIWPVDRIYLRQGKEKREDFIVAQE
jgi:hypothetical protein